MLASLTIELSKVRKPPRSMSRGDEGWPVAKSRALDRFQSRFVARLACTSTGLIRAQAIQCTY